MKKYDREKRQWVTEEEYERTHQQRNKAFCHGKTPHDYVLVLPEYVSYDETYKHNPEAYYELLDAFEAQEDKLNEDVKALGVIEKFSRGRYRRSYRFYLCSVCKKKHYEYKE